MTGISFSLKRLRCILRSSDSCRLCDRLILCVVTFTVLFTDELLHCENVIDKLFAVIQ